MVSPLLMAGNEKMKVYINFCSPLNLLNILSKRVILSTRNMRAICGKIEIAELLPPLELLLV